MVVNGYRAFSYGQGEEEEVSLTQRVVRTDVRNGAVGFCEEVGRHPACCRILVYVQRNRAFWIKMTVGCFSYGYGIVKAYSNVPRLTFLA